MKASDTLIAKLKQFEGLRLKAYKAVKTEKYYTIGYGHYGADVLATAEITERDAEKILRRDVQKVVTQLEALKLPTLTEGQADAIIDFTYNCGLANFLNSTLLRKIRRNPADPTICTEFGKWIRSGGKILEGLRKRRAWEAARWAS